VILTTEPTLRAHLFAALRPAAAGAIGAPAVVGGPAPDGGHAHVLALPSLDLMEVERRVIEQALALSNGNRTRAAQLLGINVRTLRRKLNGGDAAEAAPEVRGRVA
jgi:DNA-binding NtrC family response regulator